MLGKCNGSTGLYSCAATFVALLTVGWGDCPTALATPSDRRPNVIIVLTDDQGYGDIECHGNNKIKTPQLDRFAREGVQLRHFYCSPVCAPTRASLLTGRYFYRTGVIHTSRGGAKMHGTETTLAEMLKPAGYRAGIFGKWHLGDNYPMRPIDQGFDQSLVHKSGGIGQAPDRPNDYFNPMLWRNGRAYHAEGYCTDVFFNAAVEFVEANRDRPFFIYLATNAPHTPLTVADRYVAPYQAMGLDETTARIYGMVQNIDENFGRLLGRLDQLGLRQNTLLIFLSDNGPQQGRYNAGLRGRKGSVYEGGIRVPCLIGWPSVLKGPARVDHPAAHIDIVPTVLAACGVEPPDGVAMDGIDLLPALRGETVPERTLFFQVHRGLVPQRYHNAAVRTAGYKLLFAPTTFGTEWIPGSAAAPAELYDLQADPGEQNNIADRLPDVVDQLRKRYDAWFTDVEKTRNFQPGVIHIGSDNQNPTILCRYQDSTYVNGEPTSWSVFIQRAGRYEMTINRPDETGAGVMYVSVNGNVSSKPTLSPAPPTNGGQTTEASICAGTHSAVFQLPAGPARLDVWFQRPHTQRQRITDNSTIGNIKVRRLP